MKKNDYSIILLIIILAGAFFIGNRVKNAAFDTYYVEVEVQGEIVYKELLTEVLKDEIVIDNDNGYNKIVISDGVVNMIEADCRDQVCVQSRMISAPGESIVCLPHKIIVQITGTKRGEVDVISN
jgi:hypothetical protein